MNYSKSYIREDKCGVLRVGPKRISLDSVVIAFQHGHSAETIQDQYPGLTLEEVYGAIAFYLANRDEVHQYLQQQQELWEELRRKSGQDTDPVVQRLRSLRKPTEEENRPGHTIESKTESGELHFTQADDPIYYFGKRPLE